MFSKEVPFLLPFYVFQTFLFRSGMVTVLFFSLDIPHLLWASYIQQIASFFTFHLIDVAAF